MKRLHLYLTQNQWTRLGLLSRSSQLTVSELVRRAIDQYLQQVKPG